MNSRRGAMVEVDASWSGQHPGPPAMRVWLQSAESVWVTKWVHPSSD
ncbi:MAG: hypothetical protein P4L40_26900 [Terracidiphilus sp.]|nr:hypothetical protein [Terracidiphilus sp.]